MAVIELAEFANRDTAQVLRSLLDLAERGELAGVTVMYRERNGREDFAFSGVFRTRPVRAVNAAQRLIWRLMQEQEERVEFV